MVKEINEFMQFSDFIETKITPDHYLIRYTNLVVRYIVANPDDIKTVAFLKSFTSEKYLEIIKHVRTSEKKYKRDGATLSQQNLQELILTYMQEYETLVEAKEDDFKKLINNEKHILSKRGDDLETKTA